MDDKSKVYEDKAARLCRVVLPVGAELSINGIPVKLAGDAVVWVHPKNVPLVFPDPNTLVTPANGDES